MSSISAMTKKMAKPPSWNTMGGGVSGGVVYAVYALDANNVYVGGNFTSAGGNTANRIAKWDGMNWTVIGSVGNNSVRAIYAVDASNVYIGGDFSSVNGVSGTARIAKWDGTNWTAIGTTGLSSGAVYAIHALDANNVYIGGSFSNAGGYFKRNLHCKMGWSKLE